MGRDGVKEAFMNLVDSRSLVEKALRRNLSDAKDPLWPFRSIRSM